MARSANRSAGDGESRVTASTERGEARDLSEPRELSLEEVLKSYEQPVNEEQAWAVVYQCCSGLRAPQSPPGRLLRVKDPSSLLLYRDGTVALRRNGRTAEPSPSEQVCLTPSGEHGKELVFKSSQTSANIPNDSFCVSVVVRFPLELQDV